DGIRDFHVTGVQTCALPISSTPRNQENGIVRTNLCAIGCNDLNHQITIHLLKGRSGRPGSSYDRRLLRQNPCLRLVSFWNEKSRSEERRVGKERKDRGGGEQ